MRESHKGITSENLKKCQVFKKLKKTQKSVRFTLQMLDSLYGLANKIGKEAEMILTLPISDTEVYKITCKIDKLNILKGE